MRQSPHLPYLFAVAEAREHPDITLGRLQLYRHNGQGFRGRAAHAALGLTFLVPCPYPDWLLQQYGKSAKMDAYSSKHG